MNASGTTQVNVTGQGAEGVRQEWGPLASTVPEPSTLLLLASGMVGLGVWRTRRNR